MINRHKGNNEELYRVCKLECGFCKLGIGIFRFQYWFFVCGEGVRPMMMGIPRENLILFVAKFIYV
jgi:hypothetical protein